VNADDSIALRVMNGCEHRLRLPVASAATSTRNDAASTGARESVVGAEKNEAGVRQGLSEESWIKWDPSRGATIVSFTLFHAGVIVACVFSAVAVAILRRRYVPKLRRV